MSTAEPTLSRPAPGKPRRTIPDVDIRICLGTGGVAAGSREVLQAFEDKLAESGVLAVIRPREDDCAGRCASVTGTGCQGLCAMDPLVEVHMGHNGSKSAVTYGQVTPAMVDEIISKHILGGEIIEKWIVRTDQGPTEYDSFFDRQEKLTLRHVGIIDPEEIEDYLEADGYQALYKVLSSMTASSTSSATATRVTRAPSWIARSSRATRTPCSRAWPSAPMPSVRRRDISTCGRNTHWPYAG
jgi:(2Fe-2S) ferredoxin